MKKSLRELLLEIELGTNPEIENTFNIALKQIFSENYLAKIENIIKKRIKIKEVRMKAGAVAFNKGNNIYISKDEFPKLSKIRQVSFLLHEFVHILQRKRAFFFISRFKELNALTRRLTPIIKKNLIKPISVFLTGKNVDIGPGKMNEILAYLLNDSINWNAISPDGKEAFVRELKRSGVFNLNSKIWRSLLT